MVEPAQTWSTPMQIWSSQSRSGPHQPKVWSKLVRRCSKADLGLGSSLGFDRCSVCPAAIWPRNRCCRSRPAAPAQVGTSKICSVSAPRSGTSPELPRLLPPDPQTAESRPNTGGKRANESPDRDGSERYVTDPEGGRTPTHRQRGRHSALWGPKRDVARHSHWPSWLPATRPLAPRAAPLTGWRSRVRPAVRRDGDTGGGEPPAAASRQPRGVLRHLHRRLGLARVGPMGGVQVNGGELGGGQCLGVSWG